MKRARRLLALLLACSILFCAVPLTASAAILGDVDGNGRVNMEDALLLFRHVSGKGVLPCAASVADMNHDGVIDIRDSKILFRLVSGKGDDDPPVPGVTPEWIYMVNFAVRNTHSGKVYRAATESDLHMAVTAVVKYELGAAKYAEKSTEAWKAMAVCAYTFVARYCFDGAVYDIWLSNDVDLRNPLDYRIYEAVGEVLGVKIAFPDPSISPFSQLCQVFYSSCSSGTSCSSLAAWGYTMIPYLKPVSSPYDTDQWTLYYSLGTEPLTVVRQISFSSLVSDVSRYLGETIYYEQDRGFSFYATSLENDYWHLTNLYYYEGGQKVYVGGLTVAEATGLRSHAFQVLTQSGDILTIQTKGYGHGVGLSGFGAVGYANDAGWSYQQILKHYFSITDTTPWQLVAATF